MREPIAPTLLDVPEAATYLRLGRTKLYELLAPGGPLQPIRIGRAVRIARQDLDAYVERLREEAQTAR
jgi:excisionase family DNA binding protein